MSKRTVKSSHLFVLFKKKQPAGHEDKHVELNKNNPEGQLVQFVPLPLQLKQGESH